MIQTGSRLRTLVVFAALLLAAACSNKKLEKPAELTQFRSTAKVERVWSAKVGKGAPKLRLGLTVATDGNAVFAAARSGEVFAFNAKNGKKLWQTKTKLKLSGGPGVGEGLVVAGGSYGDIIALDAATGTQKWKTRINSEVLAAPAIGDGIVLVRMSDGRVVGLDAKDGAVLWSAEQQVPRLSLRGTAKPVIAGELGLSGFDNGRVMALNLRDGSTLWDTSVAPPSGKSEIDRLIDIDSAVKVIDGDIYAVTFQGKAARIDRETGQLLWSREVSSYAGLAADADGLYVSGSEGSVVKMGRRNGVEVWKQEVLARRRLSPPAIVGSLLVVADYEGYVHCFDTAKGELAARIHALDSRVTAIPLVIGDLIVMMDDEGRIVALRATPLAPKS